MTQLKLRITTENMSVFQDITSYIDSRSSCYMYCEEGDGVTTAKHFHYYLKTETVPVTIRRFIQGKGLKGNKSYTLTLIKDESYPLEYLAYLCKEKKYFTKNIPPEILSSALEYDEKVKSEIKGRRAKTKSNDYDLLEPIIDLCISETEIPFHFLIDQIVRTYIQAFFNVVYDFYKTNGKRFSSSQVDTTVFMFLVRKVPQFQSFARDSFERRYFRI